MYDGGVPRMKVQDVVAQSTADKPAGTMISLRPPRFLNFIGTRITSVSKSQDTDEVAIP